MSAAEMAGPVARAVVLMIRLEEGGLADANSWFWVVHGYFHRHAAAVERDEVTTLEWDAVYRAIRLIVDPDNERSRAWGVRRLHQRAELEGD